MKKVALGSVQFGANYGITNKFGRVSLKEIKKILNFAKKKKVNLIDTAINYGESEKYLGLAGLENFKVITKLPTIPKKINSVEKWIRKKINKSINKMGVNKLDGCLMHNSTNLLGTSGKQVINAIKNIKSEGIVNKFGVSIYDPKELEKIGILNQIDIVQAPINIFDNRLRTSGWLDCLYNQGIEVHARSIFLQGLLLSARKKIPKKFERWKSLWDRWDLITEKKKTLKLFACINYVLRQKEVSKIIIGVNSLSQLKQINSAYGNKRLFNNKFNSIKIDNLLIDPRKWKYL